MTQFLLNDEQIQVSDAAADQTLLNYLRDEKRQCGTKEGCASGDCGACTVVVAEPEGDRLRYRAVNSCITFLGAVDGKQVLTVEHLQQGEQLHPVQQALVDHHATQCGFCTPGFVMSMFALYKDPHLAGQEVDRETISHALSGNLCRCTGYRPIVDAALDVCSQRQPDQFDQSAPQTLARLNALADNKRESTTGKRTEPDADTDAYWRPRSRQALRSLRQAYPSAPLVAGATDLALEVTQQLKQFPGLIDVCRVPELSQIHNSQRELSLGAAVSYSEFEPELLACYPELTELLTRLGSRPVRNRGTLGGSLGNASPIGDTAPFLMALNAKIVVDDGQRRRRLPAAEFFTGYRQSRLTPVEWIESVVIPHTPASRQLRAYKISKRFDDDISTVCSVFNLQLENGRISRLGTGFGGVAATPAALPTLERELKGCTWADHSTYEKGADILSQAFTPIDDVRASARYRQRLLLSLWRRFWLETQSEQLIRVQQAKPVSSGPVSSGPVSSEPVSAEKEEASHA